MRAAASAVMTALLSCFAAGCSPTTNPEATELFTATPARAPVKVKPASGIAGTLQCMKDTGALGRKVFAVGPWVDSTGKINAVANGATGAFLPQSGTATFVTETIKRAGGQVLVLYFGPAPVSVKADYAVNGIFNSLDFGASAGADVQVAGLGPLNQLGWAQLTLSIQLDAANTRLNRQMSVLTRTVRYTQLGVSAGKVWGGTLVTGSVAVTDQQRLQFEAINGPIALGVIDVLVKEFPALSHCRKYLGDRLAAL
jgi:hypothetical protein